MPTLLRQIYNTLKCYSTAPQQAICKRFLEQLRGGGQTNLASYFADAFDENCEFNMIHLPFVPHREPVAPANPVVPMLIRMPTIVVNLSDDVYEFSVFEREIMHLRAETLKKQFGRAFIDYVGCASGRAVIGEVKRGDQNAFYALIQLLTYLSEIATPNQVARAIQHRLFGPLFDASCPFDLHIFLANFDHDGERGALTSATRDLASVFKQKITNYPNVSAVLGNILCFSADYEEPKNGFTSIKCLWQA